VTGRVDTGSSYRLAVSAEMVFVDLPFVERCDGSPMRASRSRSGLTKGTSTPSSAPGATFSSMTGYITGTLADPDGAEELLRTAEQSLKVAEQLDCPRLNVHGTGLDGQGLPVIPADVATPAMWLQAVKTLTRLAELGERAGRVFTLENSTPPSTTPHTVRQGRGHAGAGGGRRQPAPEAEPRPLPRPDRRGEPSCAGRARTAGDRRDPGRRRARALRAGTGEIHYLRSRRSLHRLGYDGVVGLEGWASGDPGVALDRFAAFTVSR
jgi:hydroxypyruvate isomerase